MRFFYNISVFSYELAIRLASVWNAKARLWVAGRKGWEGQLRNAMAGEGEWVWFHVASLGEFEQGRPLMEAFRKEWPQYKILLTFFSPSGYEVQHGYGGADYVCYLPADRPGNAQRFVELVQPKAAFFVKYEFWFNYLSALDKLGVPLLLVSGIFRPSQHFFRASSLLNPHAAWMRKQLGAFTHFFVQDKRSADLLTGIGLSNHSVTGDTRFDRVMQLVQPVDDLPVLQAFAEGANVLVAGSTWPADEDLLTQLLDSDDWPGKLLVAPHNVDEAHVAPLLKRFGSDAVRWTQATPEMVRGSRVLVVDTIGLLGRLYTVAAVTYVGGGFGAGIHNLLEAAVHGKPVVFGPNHQKFREAAGLIAAGGGASVSNYTELVTAVADDAKQAGKAAEGYVSELTGATSDIMDYLSENWYHLPGKAKDKSNQVRD